MSIHSFVRAYLFAEFILIRSRFKLSSRRPEYEREEGSQLKEMQYWQQKSELIEVSKL